MRPDGDESSPQSGSFAFPSLFPSKARFRAPILNCTGIKSPAHQLYFLLQGSDDQISEIKNSASPLYTFSDAAISNIGPRQSWFSSPANSCTNHSSFFVFVMMLGDPTQRCLLFSSPLAHNSSYW